MVIDEIAHQIGLIPILGMMVMGRKLPRIYWLVALGLFVSWFGDSAQHFIGGSWGAWYFFLPLQLWIIWVALTDSHKALAALILVALAVVSWNLSHPGPDQLMTAIGSIAILCVARGPLIWPLSIYFGAGTVARFYMVSQVGVDIFPAWCVYQICRALGILFFIGTIVPPMVHRREGRQCG